MKDPNLPDAWTSTTVGLATITTTTITDERSTNSERVNHVDARPHRKATHLLVRLHETHQRTAERRADNQQSRAS